MSSNSVSPTAHLVGYAAQEAGKCGAHAAKHLSNTRMGDLLVVSSGCYRLVPLAEGRARRPANPTKKGAHRPSVCPNAGLRAPSLNHRRYLALWQYPRI